MPSKLIATIAAIVGVSTLSLPAFADSYPDKPIRLIVPSPPGGGTDTGTPAPIVTLLNAEIVRVLDAPDTRASLAASGVDVRGGTAEQFAAYLAAERTKWSRAVKDSGAKVD